MRTLFDLLFAAYIIFAVIVVITGIDNAVDDIMDKWDRHIRRRHLRRISRRNYKLYAEADNDYLRGWYYGKYKMAEVELHDTYRH